MGPFLGCKWGTKRCSSLGSVACTIFGTESRITSQFMVGESRGICWTACESCLQSVQRRPTGCNNVRGSRQCSKIALYKTPNPGRLQKQGRFRGFRLKVYLRLSSTATEVSESVAEVRDGVDQKIEGRFVLDRPQNVTVRIEHFFQISLIDHGHAAGMRAGELDRHV